MATPSPASRRLPGPVTPAYLQRAALAYLERFASSADNLRRVLTRRIERRCRLRGEDSAEFVALVEDVVRRSLSSGLLDDRRYAEGRVASLRRRGASARLIGAKLCSKGVSREVATEAIGENAAAEHEAAWALARRRRLGPYRAGGRPAFREKDLAAMARAGFAFALAKSVIDADAPQG